MKRNTRLSLKKILTIIAPLLVVFGVILSVGLQKIYKEKPSVCRVYGSISSAEFASSYTVKQGDSLLSIARERLGDPSRVNELIELNHKRYPQLSLTNSFVEVGWQLLIPRADLPISSGNITGIQGVLTLIDTNTWAVHPSSAPTGLTVYIYHNDKTLFKEKEQKAYKTNECVKVIYDSKGNTGLSVSPL